MSTDMTCLGEKLCKLLNEAVTCPGTPIDPARANSLLLELLTLLPSDDDSWQRGLTSVIQPTVDAFISRPHDWHPLLKVAATHLRLIHTTSEHPQARKHVLEGAGGNKNHPIYFNLEEKLLLEILNRATEEQRVEFLRGAQNWATLRMLCSVGLGQFRFRPSELVELLNSFTKATAADLGGGRIFQNILDSIHANPSTAIEIIDKWREGSQFIDLDPNALALLVRGIVSGVGSGGVVWRDRVIQRLEELNEERWWQTATHLACVAWPPNTDVQVRHEALLLCTRRHPERLLSIALRTIVEDTQAFPAVTLNTALKLLKMAPQSADAGSLIEWRIVLGRILEIIFNDGTRVAQIQQSQLDVALETIIYMPKTSSPDSLDTIFEKLAQINEERAQALMGRWLLLHGHQLLEAGSTLTEAFPLLDLKVCHAWLLQYMISNQSTLRALGIRLWNRKGSIPKEALEKIETEKLQGLLYQLAGSGMFGQKWVIMVVEIGKHRQDILDRVIDILTSAAIFDYPGTCRRAIEQLWKCPDQPALITATEKVMQVLDHHQQRWSNRTQLPELKVTEESFPIVLEIEQRRMQEQMREYERSGQSLAALIATKQNMAYGARSITAWGPNHETTIEPKQVRSDMYEQSLLATIDTIAAAVQWRKYTELAAKLLD